MAWDHLLNSIMIIYTVINSFEQRQLMTNKATLNKKKSKKALKIYLKPSADPARVPEIYAPQEPLKKDK